MRQREHGGVVAGRTMLPHPSVAVLPWRSEVKGTAKLGSVHRNTDSPVRPHTRRQASHLKVSSSSMQQRRARDLSAQILPLWSQDSLRKSGSLGWSACPVKALH